jgi:carbon storage regulator
LAEHRTLSKPALAAPPTITDRRIRSAPAFRSVRRGTLTANKECAMLVLSRQRDESIMIGDNIVITVVDIRGDKVRLGINAPTEVPVHRQEVYEAIQRENLRASRLEPQDVRDLSKNRTPRPNSQ